MSITIFGSSVIHYLDNNCGMYYRHHNDGGRSAAFESTYHLPTTQDDPHYAPLPTDRSLGRRRNCLGSRARLDWGERIQCVWDYFL
jgi:hypothetical protein